MRKRLIGRWVGKVVEISKVTRGRRRGRGIVAHMYRPCFLFVREGMTWDEAVCKANALVMLPWCWLELTGGGRLPCPVAGEDIRLLPQPRSPVWGGEAG